MPYIDPFNSIVQTTKKNNRYYGPTESSKIASYLSEIQSDLNTLFDELNTVRTEFNALASGYFTLGSNPTAMYNIKAKMEHLLDKVNNRIYVQAQSIPPA